MDNAKLLKACATCKFSNVERAPNQIVTVRFCRRFPPSFMLMPTPDGNVASVATWPQVQDSAWCYEYQEDEAANAEKGAIIGPPN